MRAQTRFLLIGTFRFLLVTVLSFVLLVGTAFLIASGIAYVNGGAWSRIDYLIVGLSCGLITWLFIAVFHLRHETQEVSFSQKEPFLAEAKVILQEMGYAIAAQQPNQVTFRPSFHAFLFGGDIRLVMEDNIARLTGPKVSLEIFRRYYRLQHHVQRVQQVLSEHRKFTDTRLKRVELCLRLRPEQMETVRKNVISVLQEDGEVVCELHLLVQSEHGIRENVLEFQIRESLAQMQISCDIHKDLVQFVEVASVEREFAAV